MYRICSLDGPEPPALRRCEWCMHAILLSSDPRTGVWHHRLPSLPRGTGLLQETEALRVKPRVLWR